MLQKIFKKIFIMALVVVTLLTIPGGLASMPAQAQTRRIEVDFSGQGLISFEVQKGVIQTLTAEAYLFTDRTFFMLTSYRQYQNSWVELRIAAPESSMPATLQGAPGNFMLLQHTPAGWVGHLEAHPDYQQLRTQAPADFLEPMPPDQIGILSVSHKFPWLTGESWELTQGWHASGFQVQNNLDFAPAGSTSSDVLASAAGTLAAACNRTDDTQQVAFRITHADGSQTEYLHVSKSTARLDLVGQYVPQGQYLGDIYYAYNFSTPCGFGTGPHLHFGLSDKSVSLDGHSADSVGTAALYTEFVSSNDPNNSSTEQVKLYSESNFNGSVVWQGASDSNDPNADSYSMELPSGWSVKVYDQDNYTGSERCWNSSVNNLQDHGWQLRIRSIRVYQSDVCGGSTPTDEVKLYSESNFSGSVVWHGSSDSNGPNADSYSMQVPSGWSVKVYDQDNYTGSERCWNSSVNNLQDHGWHLKIQSIRVYQSDVCLAPPAAPSYVTASDGTYTDRVYVDWPVVSGATGYEVWRATSSGGTKTRVSSPTSSYYNDTSATPGTTYYYWVKACNSAGCSGYSSYNGGYRGIAPPAAPSYVTATDGTYTDRVYVNWPDVTDATSYEVYRATSSGGTKTKLSSPTSSYYNDTSATPGTTYYYWVKACNSAGCSGYSSYNSGYRGIAPPAAPSYVTASDGTYTDRVYVDWPVVSGATGYEVYRATSSGGTKTKLSSPTSSYYNDYSASAGTTYYYWVKACNSSGCSDYSGYNSGYRGIAPPAAPSYVTATDGTYTDRVYVDWPVVSGATYYEVYRATSSSGTKTKLSSPTSSYYNDTSATAGTTYYYWAKACNSGGCSGYSSYNSGYRSVAASPVLAYSDLSVDDNTFGESNGNDDSVANCGEDIELWVYLENTGAGAATGVSVNISTADPYVTWLYNTSSTYPDIAAGQTAWNNGDFDFSLVANTPPNHTIRFNLNIYADGGYAATDSFDLPTACGPLDSIVINEIEVGNPDWVELRNTGNQAATLTGWQFKAYHADGYLFSTYTFPSFTLQPGAYVVLHENTGTNSATALYTGSNSLPWVYDDGGAAALTTGNGIGVDFVRWGSSTVSPPYGTGWTGLNPTGPAASGETLVRINSVDTDDGSDWNVSAPSPGQPNNEQNSVYLPLILRH